MIYLVASKEGLQTFLVDHSDVDPKQIKLIKSRNEAVACQPNKSDTVCFELGGSVDAYFELVDRRLMSGCTRVT